MLRENSFHSALKQQCLRKGLFQLVSFPKSFWHH